jgi:hypothetical protein
MMRFPFTIFSFQQVKMKWLEGHAELIGAWTLSRITTTSVKIMSVTDRPGRGDRVPMGGKAQLDSRVVGSRTVGAN